MNDSALPADDEFRFLAGDAERVGRAAPLPVVERVRASVGEGRVVSGLRFGAPADPEVVALHGAGLNAHSFDPMLLALGAPALALDLPGHGRSDWRDDADYRPQRLAPDVTVAIERCSHRPVALLGHSLGGLTAALVAASRPALVGRLVVVDITPGVSPSGDAGAVAEFITGQRHYATVDEIVDRAIRFGIGSDRAALTRGVSLNTRRRPDGRIEWTHHLAHLDALPAGGGGARPYAEIWDALQSLEIPVSLIRADSGMLNDALVEEWRRRLPRAEVITLAGPHNLHEAAPTALAEAVRRSSR
ncbi:alpha/beta fold hydrolase [Leucobacter triazinivorans]|uniref:Alpha/beta hydrolase n=1 Tax=Leucobacter triazinivorans TaxID=1784719 RepID=A0A4P6KBW8_9MICO|nr:alpha/beta hydrolase [Leucobacter triazinivorans]QBE47796.1 alpha/beta hydrolase [Leucobacter triazinivorans]